MSTQQYKTLNTVTTMENEYYTKLADENLVSWWRGEHDQRGWHLRADWCYGAFCASLFNTEAFQLYSSAIDQAIARANWELTQRRKKAHA